MRNLVLLFILSALLVSCGGGGGGGASDGTTASNDSDLTEQGCTTDPNLVGNWYHNDVNATLSINGTCKVVSDYCDSTIIISPRENVTDRDLYVTFDMQVFSSNGAQGCYSVGKHTNCLYRVSLGDDQQTQYVSFGCYSASDTYIKI